MQTLPRHEQLANAENQTSEYSEIQSALDDTLISVRQYSKLRSRTDVGSYASQYSNLNATHDPLFSNVTQVPARAPLKDSSRWEQTMGTTYENIWREPTNLETRFVSNIDYIVYYVVDITLE